MKEKKNKYEESKVKNYELRKTNRKMQKYQLFIEKRKVNKL